MRKFQLSKVNCESLYFLKQCAKISQPYFPFFPSRKSQITPWVIVGYNIVLNVNVTEAEAVEYECAILDRENGTITLDNDTKIITLNDTSWYC